MQFTGTIVVEGESVAEPVDDLSRRDRQSEPADRTGRVTSANVKALGSDWLTT